MMTGFEERQFSKMMTEIKLNELRIKKADGYENRRRWESFGNLFGKEKVKGDLTVVCREET